MFAGEVSSGKSSLLNLIFGTSILPTSLLSCTSVICELKYGREPYALAHSWDDKRPPERIELTEKNASEVLAPYVHQKGDRLHKFPFKRIQVFWPFDALKVSLAYALKSYWLRLQQYGCNSIISLSILWTSV